MKFPAWLAGKFDGLNRPLLLSLISLTHSSMELFIGDPIGSTCPMLKLMTSVAASTSISGKKKNNETTTSPAKIVNITFVLPRFFRS
jgi:hypothetical protein